MRNAVLASALCTAVACGAPGLPPAGPGPGEVDVGYDTRPKKDVTGAVSSVDTDRPAETKYLRVEEMLRGRVPGLQVMEGRGGQYTFRIRGTNSLLFDQEPLFVIDGIQISRGSLPATLAGLNPEDVRQVDVLRDISSTSIYGSRGAGGVILITTRR